MDEGEERDRKGWGRKREKVKESGWIEKRNTTGSRTGRREEKKNEGEGC